MHALWCCPSLKMVTTMCPFVNGVRATDNIQFFDCMIACKNQLRSEEMELLCMVIWSIWFKRNGKVLHDADMVCWADSYLADYRRANGINVVSSKVLDVESSFCGLV